MRQMKIAGILACLSLVAACAGDAPTTPREAAGPSLMIVDGNHNAGNPHFFFLPPTVPSPRHSPRWTVGAFDDTQRPTVEVCALDLPVTATEADVALSTPCKSGGYTAHFPFGTSGSVVTMHRPSNGDADDDDEDDHDDGGHFHAKWRVPVSADVFFRVRVVSNGYLLGFADVHSVTNGRELRNVQTGEFIARRDGETLNIKFRIEKGIFPLQLTKVSGDLQSGPTGAALGIPLVVRLTNASGYPAAGMAIGFTATDGAASASAVLTDTDGRAQVTWTLGGVAGNQSLAASLAGATGSPATFTATAIAAILGRIAYQSEVFGEEIFVMNADGTNIVRATFTGSAEAPRWSPDGKHIAYQGPGQDWDIHVVDIAADGTGSNDHILASDPARDIYPSWSPDGTKLAFVSTRSVAGCTGLPATPKTYVMDLAGNILVCLLDNSPDGGAPSWSPDGTLLTFFDNGIWVMNALTGGDRVRLTTGGDDYFPTFSPDGSLIVFERGQGGIYTMPPVAGATPTFVVAGRYPSWSPTGQEVVYVEGFPGAEQIFRINKNGSIASRVQVAVTSSRDLEPVWTRY